MQMGKYLINPQLNLHDFVNTAKICGLVSVHCCQPTLLNIREQSSTSVNKCLKQLIQLAFDSANLILTASGFQNYCSYVGRRQYNRYVFLKYFAKIDI